MKPSVIRSALLIAAASAATSSADEPSPSMRAMQDELGRTMTLSLPDAPKPYFASFRVVERQSVYATASFGALVAGDDLHLRKGYVDVRVGSRELDGSTAREGWRDWEIPVEAMACGDDYDAVRRDLWSLADRAFKKSEAKLARVQAALQTQATRDERLPEFSAEPVTKTMAKRASVLPPRASVESLANALSAEGRKWPALQSCQVFAFAGRQRLQFASSEGSTADDARGEAWVDVELSTTALDGMPLSRRVSFWAADWSQLPAIESMTAALGAAAEELVKLRDAPLLDNYSGPVLFEGRAAAQLVAEILAPELAPAPEPRVSLQEGAEADEGSAFAAGLGTRVLPAGVRVTDDPTIDRLGAVPLAGAYAADDQGVPGAKVQLIDDGVLLGFLTSRAPRRGQEHSNGHGRASWSEAPGVTIGNLLLSSMHPATPSRLRSRLIASARARKLAFGLIVRELSASDGSAWSMRIVPSYQSSSQALPLVVVKVGLDGKEVLVRAGRFRDLSVGALDRILEVGAATQVVSEITPTSMSVGAPPLLLEKVSLVKPAQAFRAPPSLPRPGDKE